MWVDIKPWIGVDLDGTLAIYEKWVAVDHIGPPIPAMVERVKRWLGEGKDVRIFTARVGGDPVEATHQRNVIQAWCYEHIGVVLPVTAVKDYGMVELWDDRAVQVVKNTGECVGKQAYDAAYVVHERAVVDGYTPKYGDLYRILADVARGVEGLMTQAKGWQGRA